MTAQPVREVRRPTPAEYERALELYRGALSEEEIADTVGLPIAVVEQLIDEGFPAGDGQPELVSFRLKVQDQIVRVRTSQLAWMMEVVESARATAPRRRKSAETASRIEQAILSAWSNKVGKQLREAERSGEPLADAEVLAMPIAVTRSLKALRDAQDPSVDQKIAALFAMLDGDAGSDDSQGESREGLLARLAAMTPEQQDEYARTGRWPQQQQRLPGVE